MSEIIPFDFEEQAVRVVMREAAPWFVAADICRVLEIANASDAMSRLDEDEKDGVGITDPIGRNQMTRIISESGLYALVLTSRKEAAKRFRKWVTAEVLPAIRRTGHYDLHATPAPAPQEPQFGDDLSTRDKLTMIRETRLLHGIPAGRRMWAMLDLPDVSGRADAPALLVSPEEGRACLSYLLGLDVGGRPVSDWLADAEDAEVLNRAGLRVQEDGLFVAHPTPVFAGSRWSGGRHRVALSALEGVRLVGNPLTLLGQRWRGMIVPLTVIAGGFHA